MNRTTTLTTAKIWIWQMAAIQNFYFDSSKYENDARNGFPMPQLVGQVILHGFLCPLVFKLHFQYGRRRPSWILLFRQKYKNGAINRLPMPHLVGKVVLHRFLCPFIFKLHFQYGRRGHFGFWLLQNSAAFSWGSWELFFFLISQRAQIKCQNLLCSRCSQDPQISPN